MQLVPVEYNEEAYIQEVLQMKVSQVDLSNWQHHCEKVENTEIVTSPVMLTPNKLLQISSQGSEKSKPSIHVRSLSSASLSSSSTALSSQISCDLLEEASYTVRRKMEVMARMDVMNQNHENMNSLKNFDLSTTVNQLNPTSRTIASPKPHMRIKDRIRTKVFKPKQKLSQKNMSNQKHTSCCVRCREAFEYNKSLHCLPCNHPYCKCCLQTLIMQASEDESKMPPRCCTKIIPGAVIGAVLKEDDRVKFLKSVLQFRNRLESQILCPNVNCSGLFSEFEPTNSLRPLEVACRKCSLCICSLCKGPSHPLDVECPSEWARHTIVKLHDDKCQLSQGNCKESEEKLIQKNLSECETLNTSNEICKTVSHMDNIKLDPTPTIKNKKECKGRQEVSITGSSVHESYSRLPDNDDSEEMTAAKTRTAQSVDLSNLRAQQLVEKDRFCEFERKMGCYMTTRHNQERKNARETYEKRLSKMKEHHTKIAAQLEDIQVAAEFEMISAFKKTELNVRNRLRHMEAYCDALGRDSSDSSTGREVTERDLRQLGQQYNLRDSMYHIHQNKIKVLRDKQSKQMERLLMQQERELERFMTRREDITLAEQRFKKEKDGLSQLFAQRKSALLQKWALEEQNERERLEMENKQRYAPISPPIDWPE